ncbi:TlpA family protein disulfide reductase [bacterium]|nr:MAG: TlpA family protein disulfide reductase [bacterium]
MDVVTTMKLRALSVLPFAALLAAGAFAQAPPATQPPITLKLGDAAPELTIVKWLKGTPQTDLKDGKVRVVEFWATWCGPCKVGMPHLSELSKRYGSKVAFVGVDASERVDDIALAEKFVQDSGDMMAYNVAYATPKGPMTQNWMRAAGQNGIPCAFVVDKHGKIGWIGHPLMGLEEAVDLALQDKLDAKAAAEIDKTWEANMAKGQESFKALAAAQKDGKVDEALKLNEEVLRLLPYMVTSYAPTQYTLLTAKDPEAAAKFGNGLLKEKANAPLVLQAVATTIVNENSAVKGARDYKLAKTLIEQSLKCSAVSYGSNQTLARIAFATGDKEGAVRFQQEAVKMIPAGEAYNRVRTAAEKLLAEYQAAR